MTSELLQIDGLSKPGARFLTERVKLTVVYQIPNTVKRRSTNKDRSELSGESARVVEMMPVRLVDVVPALVVEMMPVLVVEMMPVLVVEIMPDLANAGADIATTKIPAQTIGLRFFIVLLLVLKRQGLNWSARSS